ncbi:RNA-directed RNA polymerase L [Striga asiatica]|uniref:RNA-directed RNA polymerase L n=1 Tax=Striga asiatica TaxID=4170 RepID=A0A5A7PMZ7_STRAF|nr:RNA-directed RNA polymerase L [Striga asiatica]
MPQHTLPEAKILETRPQPLVLHLHPPVPVAKVPLLSLPPVPLERRLLLRPQQTVPLQLPRHRVVDPPPRRVRHVTCELPQQLHIPVTVIVPKAKPGLEPQVVEHVEHGRVGTEHSGLHLLPPILVPFPEMLQEIHTLRNSVPPREDLVEVALIPTVVRLDLVYMVHQELERAFRRLNYHHARVEERGVVPRGRNLWHLKRAVISFGLGFGVANAEDGMDLPAGGLQAGTVMWGDGIIDEDDEVTR